MVCRLGPHHLQIACYGPVCTLTLVLKGCLILPSLVTEFMRSVHNSRKNQLYTYKTCRLIQYAHRLILVSYFSIKISSDWKQSTVPEMEPLQRQMSLFYVGPSHCQPRFFYSQPRQPPCACEVMTTSAHIQLDLNFPVPTDICLSSLVAAKGLLEHCWCS